MRNHLTLYPDLPDQRRRQVVRDRLTVLLIACFAWCGFQVHDLVGALPVQGTGDLSKGRYDAVTAAALADVGLMPRGHPTTAN